VSLNLERTYKQLGCQTHDTHAIVGKQIFRLPGDGMMSYLWWNQYQYHTYINDTVSFSCRPL